MKPKRMKTATAAATDLGRRRSGNEDSHGVSVEAPAGSREAPVTLLIVADGMGGSNAGEVASSLAVEAVTRVWRDSKDADPIARLQHAVEIANTEVYEHSRTRADLNGMGTTCTVIAVRGDEAWFAHVGDSRAYLVHGGKIRQLTTDHSLVAQLVQRRQLTPEEAKVDPRRNVVTRSVGVGPQVEVDGGRIEQPLEPGDTLVICSDGLHGQVNDNEIAAAASGESLDQACADLISLANQRGGPDNITVVMARIEDARNDSGGRGRGSNGAHAGETGRTRTLTLLIAAVLALALTLAAIAWIVSRIVTDQAERTGAIVTQHEPSDPQWA